MGAYAAVGFAGVAVRLVENVGAAVGAGGVEVPLELGDGADVDVGADGGGGGELALWVLGRGCCEGLGVVRCILVVF